MKNRYEGNKPVLANQAVYESLDDVLSSRQKAFQALRHAISKGSKAHMREAIAGLRREGVDPDRVVVRASNAKQAFWYQPATLVLVSARSNAHVLLQTMSDEGMDVLSHRFGLAQPGHFRTLAHAFIIGFSGARAAPVQRFTPDDLDMMNFKADEPSHKLDSRPLLKLLGSAGLDWAAQDSNGKTILHQAIEECSPGDLRTMCLLAMDKGVNPGRMDNNGKTALDLGRLRLSSLTSTPDREQLSFLLAEVSQAAMEFDTPSSTADSKPAPRI